MSKTKNDKAWSKLFEKYNILREIEANGYCEISSSQINEFREARLMTKFDHRSNLPELFVNNKLSILPITRGSYIISQFDAYKDIEEINTEIVRVPFPEYIESIDYEDITSEAIALNCAYVSGIIADFMEDEGVIPAVSGRMSSSSFKFLIKTLNTKKDFPVTVLNSQVEIDGGFEGYDNLALLEAKISISNDFLIRQLYYPFRLFNNRISKAVKPIFITYSNNMFSFYEYIFQDPNNYNSLVLAKQKNYIIEQEDISLSDIIEILHAAPIVAEPEIPFPQADSFKRVINLCELLLANDLTREDITTNYDFDPRQTNYYTSAGMYLGLIEKKRADGSIVYYISNLGRGLLKQNYKVKQLFFVKLILEHKAFNETLKMYFDKGEMPDRDEIINIMKQSNLYNVEADSTFMLTDMIKSS